MTELRVREKYRLGKRIKTGAFWSIYLGVDVQTQEEVVVKIEPTDSKNAFLSYEAKVLKFLQGHAGIPQIHSHGIEGEFYVIVM